MSSSRYKITVVCIPLEYLPFPISIIRKSKFSISEFCGDDHFTAFFISDKNSNDPALLFYSVKSALQEYKKLTQENFNRSEFLTAKLLLSDDWLKLSSDPSNFEITYLEDYFNGDGDVLKEHIGKITHPITCIRRDLLKDLDEELNREINKMRLLSEKAILEKNISEQNDIVEKKLFIKRRKI